MAAADEDLECLRKTSTTTATTSPKSGSAMLGSCRLNLALLCLVATLAFFLMRLNLSFALVCMVGRVPAANASRTSPTTDDDVDDAGQAAASSAAPVVDWDKETQGSVLAAFYYGFCATQIFGGWLADRLGRSKSILVSSMAAMSLLSLASPAVSAWNSRAFFALRLLLGLVSGLALPTIQPLFARWSAPDERATLLGLAFAGFTLGSSVTFPVSSFLCLHGFGGGWPSVFYLSGLLGVVWVVLAQLLIFDSPEEHPRISPQERHHLEPYSMKAHCGNRYNKEIPWRAILTSGPVNTLNACTVCFNWGFYTLVSGLPLFLKEAYHFDITQNGLLSSMPYAAALIVHLVAGKVFDWCRRRQFFSLTATRKMFNTAGFLLPALSVLAVGQLSYEHRYVAVLLLAVSQAAGELAIMGGFLLSNMDLAPQYTGVLQGLASTVGTVPGFVSPVVMSYLTPQGTQSQWAVVFYISAGFYVLGAVLYLAFGTSRRQPWADDARTTPAAAAAVALNESPSVQSDS